MTIATMRIVVMGVSGCGKSTVGRLLAERLEAKFVDGDDLHPEENKAKMAAGIALNDEDRLDWLDAVASTLVSKTKMVVACSALKKKYRDQIRAVCPDAVFVHLSGSPEVLKQRLESRSNHFMPVSLLESQLQTLEPLSEVEVGATISIDLSIDEIVAEAVDFCLSRKTS